MTDRIGLEAAAEERLLDAMLSEVALEPQLPSAGATARRSRWLAAAMVLLGLAVVAGVFASKRAERAVAVTPQEPALPPPVRVRSLTDLQQVDRDVENLWCSFARPEQMAVLKEFRRLRGLHVQQDMPPARFVRDPAWSLAALAECTQLEWVSVGYFGRNRHVADRPAPFEGTDLAPLAKLPHLRALELQGGEKVLDAGVAEALGKLPLRSLVLVSVFCARDALRSLADLPLLERLELHQCAGLTRCDVDLPFRMPRLRALVLRGVGGLGAETMERESERSEPFVSLESRRHVFTGGWMRALAKGLPGLRELDLAESRIDDAVLAALPKQLAVLTLSRSAGWGDLAVGHGLATPDPVPDCSCLAELPQLQRIEVIGPNPELESAIRRAVGDRVRIVVRER